jgi:hypothetical protein
MFLIPLMFRVAVDPTQWHGFIMYPDPEVAEALCARYAQVGAEHVFFDLVRNVEYLSFDEDVNQHLQVF